jgi:predicted membrane protein
MNVPFPKAHNREQSRQNENLNELKLQSASLKQSDLHATMRRGALGNRRARWRNTWFLAHRPAIHLFEFIDLQISRGIGNDVVTRIQNLQINLRTASLRAAENEMFVEVRRDVENNRRG